MLPSVLVNDTPSDDDPPEHTTNPFVERVVPLDAWNAEGVRRFGHDRKQWAFVCPSCGERIPVALYEQHGGTGGVGVACIGQFIPEEELPEDKYCTYGVGSGKVLVHPVRVVFPDGEVHPFFDFADGSWPLPLPPFPRRDPMATTTTPKKRATKKPAAKRPAKAKAAKRPEPKTTYHIGLQLRAARQAKGVSQEELATRLGTRQPIVSAWEHRSNVTPATVAKVAKALGIDPQTIYTSAEAKS